MTPTPEPKAAVTVQAQPESAVNVAEYNPNIDPSSGVPVETIKTGNAPTPEMTDVMPQPEPIGVEASLARKDEVV